MSMARDNWERLVAAVLDKEELRRLAYCSSLSSCSSSAVASSRFRVEFTIDSSSDATMKELLNNCNLHQDAASMGHLHAASTELVLSEKRNELATQRGINRKVMKSLRDNVKRLGRLRHGFFNDREENNLHQQGPWAVMKYKYSEIVKITNSFNDELGRGGSSIVYKGRLLDGCVVAVKVLNERDSNGELFINEVVTISRTSHVNVINLLGFCNEKNKKALVYEFMPNKSLGEFIGNVENPNCPYLDIKNLYKIAVGVARGLEYLHTGCSTSIVHFDIKPQNILIDEEFTAKISDFGLAKLCQNIRSMLSVINARGTVGYIAPEVLYKIFGEVSHKSDVYSYGMMVLEMAETGAFQSGLNFYSDDIYDKVIQEVTREVAVESMVENEKEKVLKMFLVGFWCIQTIPLHRPTMSKVVEMLEGNLKDIAIPPKQVVHQAENSNSMSFQKEFYDQLRLSYEFLNDPEENILLQRGLLAPKRYKYYEIKVMTKSFSDKLGHGWLCTVYKGTLANGYDVAVKVLNEAASTREEFINEVVSIGRTSHVNIVNLLGFCHEQTKRALVYEYMPNKSLEKFIGKASDPNFHVLDIEKLFKIAIGVAKGLEYWHSGCNTKMVHFDIKPQNILLDKEFCPKISEFGLAKLCKTKTSIVSVHSTRGTVACIAPEMFYKNFGEISQKCDVYSYGMMVLKMIGATNMDEIETSLSSENYFPDNIYEKVVREISREVDVKSTMQNEDERVLKMYLVGFWCIQTTPLPRPTMSKVVEMFEGNLKNIQLPPKPTLCDLLRLPGPDLSTNEEVEESREG